MNYQDYQNQVSSEKIVLATLDASKRLMGWEVHSGSIYKLENIAFPVVISVEDSGTAYTEAASIVGVTASKYFFDRATQTLYVRTTGSDNPNGRFIAVTYRLFFSNVPIALPHDLDQGYEVMWEPTIKSNSEFGVGIDTVNQSSESIEGSGSLTLVNDQSFWLANFDKLTFDNKDCSIYSFHRGLEITEAKLLFKGKVNKKDYSPNQISFGLSDQMSELRALIRLETIETLGERNPTGLNLAYQRMILGRVYGHRPANLDAVNEGYPLTGTISVTSGSESITGSGTLFLTELSPDDTITIEGVKYTVATSSSQTAMTLTEAYSGVSNDTLSVTVVPNLPKRWINRRWLVAGHAVREPVMTTTSGSTSSKLNVDSTEDIYPGDSLYVGTLGSGELATVLNVQNSNTIRLATSLAVAPTSGVSVTRPSVQNVRLNDVLLTYYRDYTFNAATGILTLSDTAEANAGPIRQLAGDLTFNFGSRTVTGSGLDTIIKPGYMVGVVNNADFFEVAEVSEDSLLLRSNCTFPGTTTETGRYKPFVFGDNDVMTCDVLGRTDDGSPSGLLLKTASEIVKVLLEDAGFADSLDEDSFTAARSDAPAAIGMVIPTKYNDTKVPSYRDAINLLSKSINGNIIQTQAFNLSYFVAQPSKAPTALRLAESDIISFDLDTTADKIVKTVVVNYRPREYDYLTKTNSIRTEQASSDNANYLLKTERTRTLETKLVDEKEARRFANRWSFLLETSTGVLKLQTKLQAALIEVGDVIDISHRKLFVRFGGTDSRRLFLVESVKKTGRSVSIEAVDLSNGFNRIANITDVINDHTDATDDEKIYGGFITDEYGMQDNDPETHGQNLIY